MSSNGAKEELKGVLSLLSSFALSISQFPQVGIVAPKMSLLKTREKSVRRIYGDHHIRNHNLRFT